MSTMTFVVSNKFRLQDIGAVLLLNFFGKTLFDCFLELKSSPATIPLAVFIAAILAPFGKQIIPLAVVAKVTDRNPYEINTFL